MNKINKLFNKLSDNQKAYLGLLSFAGLCVLAAFYPWICIVYILIALCCIDGNIDD